MFNRTAVITLMAGVVAALAAGAGRADVMVEQKIAVDGFGPMKFGAMEGKTVTAVSGDKARTQRQTQFKSGLLRVIARGAGGETVNIVRLDQERIYDLNVAKKQYTETTFQEMRDAAAKALQNSQSAKPAGQQQAPSGAPVDESKCEWSPARTSVKQSGEHATIAGADAARATITVTQTCTDKTKGTSCDFVYVLDQWLTPDLPGEEETRTFWRNYGRKLNLGGDIAASMQANAQQVFERYKSGWGEAIKQAGTLKGYPVKTLMAMQFGGPQCKSDDSGSGSGAADGGTGSSRSSSVPTSGGDVASNLAMSLFSKLHKKDEPAAPAAAPVEPGMVQLFGMSTETTVVRTDPIPGAAFEVPAGFTKIQPAAAQ